MYFPLIFHYKRQEKLLCPLPLSLTHTHTELYLQPVVTSLALGPLFKNTSAYEHTKRMKGCREGSFVCFL